MLLYVVLDADILLISCPYGTCGSGVDPVVFAGLGKHMLLMGVLREEIFPSELRTSIKESSTPPKKPMNRRKNLFFSSNHRKNLFFFIKP
jgi:hypothetical protein